MVVEPWCFWFWPHWAHPTLSPWFARAGVEKAEASTATDVSAIRRRTARRIGTAPLRKPASITAQDSAHARRGRLHAIAAHWLVSLQARPNPQSPGAGRRSGRRQRP